METAVLFLLSQYEKQNTFLYSDDFEQAMEIEKQQIIDAYNDGGEKGFNEFGENFEQYYNKTYKNK